MPGAYSSLHYHIVFSTKDRRPWLADAGARSRLWDYIGGILKNIGCIPLRVGGTADHVHVLCSIPRTRAVADAVRDIKANSSRWLREASPELSGFGWQEAYAIFTVGISGLERNASYIDRQEEHHRVRSFDDELAAFLRRHGIEMERWSAAPDGAHEGDEAP
ncbi:MAG: IS200/IS605 family transposase [Armatimonadetes bacterium]|nr:IS200/IS605 family transposase [Armatimonadota bacterium]